VPRLAQAFHDADGGVFHGGHTLIERFGRCKREKEIVGMRERLGGKLKRVDRQTWTHELRIHREVAKNSCPLPGDRECSA
jgi:hypothetical protein